MLDRLSRQLQVNIEEAGRARLRAFDGIAVHRGWNQGLEVEERATILLWSQLHPIILRLNFIMANKQVVKLLLAGPQVCRRDVLEEGSDGLLIVQTEVNLPCHRENLDRVAFQELTATCRVVDAAWVTCEAPLERD